MAVTRGARDRPAQVKARRSRRGKAGSGVAWHGPVRHGEAGRYMRPVFFPAEICAEYDKAGCIVGFNPLRSPHSAGTVPRMIEEHDMTFHDRFTKMGTRALTDDQLRAVAPSIFATEAHESRSDRFAPIATINVIEGLRREGFEVYKAAQSRCRDEGKKDFTKHQVRLRHRTDMERSLKIGDSTFEVILTNANDGTSAYHMTPGVFRLVCLNGLMTSQGSYQGVKVRHSGNAVGEVIEGAYTVLSEGERVMDAVGRYTGIRLTAPEQQAFAEAAHLIRFPREEGEASPVPFRPDQLLRARRYGDDGDDLWRVFNRTQENIIRGGARATTIGPNGRRRNASMRAVTGIAQDAALNRALWSLAERMAEIKAAA